MWQAPCGPRLLLRAPCWGRCPESVRAQVAIIGAGYTGLSAALHLAEAGRDVVVLEAVDVGERASGLNGGQVIPGVKHDPDTLEEMFGPVVGSRLVDTVASGPDVVFDLIQKYEIACAATRTGLDSTGYLYCRDGDDHRACGRSGGGAGRMWSCCRLPRRRV